MYQLDEEPVQTIDLYVVPRRHVEYCEPINIGRIINRVLCFLCLPLLLLVPSCWQDTGPWTLFVSLQLLPAQTFTATATIGQSGTRVIPATNARGSLTVYNGSILAQRLQKGFIVEAVSGVAIVTDAAVVIPAGDPPAFGVARVPAHAVQPGQAGNVGELAVSSVYGTSLYIKNLIGFSGGSDATTEQYATEEDKQAALSSALYRLKLETKRPDALLDGQCPEEVTSADLSLTVTWQCQFMCYEVPRGLRVLSAVRDGDRVKLEVRR